MNNDNTFSSGENQIENTQKNLSNNSNSENLNTKFFAKSQNVDISSPKNDVDYDNEETRLKKLVMEKDKIIYEYLRNIKELERTNEQNKKNIIIKDELINKINQENKDLKFKLNTHETNLQRKEEELNKFKSFSEEKLLNLSKEKHDYEEKLNQLNKLYEKQQIEFANLERENKKQEKNMYKFKQFEITSNETLINYEKALEEMKREVKTIPNYKKQINYLENQLSEIKEELSDEREKYDTLHFEKLEIEKKLSNMIEFHSGENSIDRLKSHINNLTYQLENKIKDNENLEKGISNAQEKYKLLMKENESFINIISNELGKIGNFINNLLTEDQIIQDETNNQFKLINLQKSSFSLKYELISKNFDCLRNKLIEYNNHKIETIVRVKKDKDELSIKIKENMEERSKFMKEFVILNQSNIENKDKLAKSLIESDKIRELFTNLKENYAKLKNDYDDICIKYESTLNEIQNFVNKFFHKMNNIQDNSSSQSILKERTISEEFENILEKFDFFIRENNKMTLKDKDFYDKSKELIEEINYLKEGRNELLNKCDQLKQEYDKKLNECEYGYNQELSRNRETLVDKINSLTKLLEESNFMISEYEKENSRLKYRNDKLEYNLQMLTDSHIELEENINSNFQSLNLQIEDKETKYNNLLRELEIKDMQILSYENLLKRKDEEFENLKETKKYLITGGIEKLRQNEKENILINNNSVERGMFENNRESRNLSDNFEINKKNLQYDSYSEIKIPGKIFSSKKKI